MAFDYNPYEFLPKLPSFTLTSESRDRRQAAVQ